MLDFIHKGISLDHARRILADCDRAGAEVILNFMVGFPGEAESEAEMSVDFLNELTSRHPNLRLLCNTQVVKLYINSKFHAYPDRYGYTWSNRASPVAGSHLVPA